MNEQPVNRFAYRIIPALRMLIHGEKHTGIIRTDNSPEIVKASFSEDMFHEWEKTWQGEKLFFFDWKEDEKDEEIIKRFTRKMIRGNGLTIVRNLGLMAWGPYASVVQLLLEGKSSKTADMNSLPRFAGKIVVITGAAQGFGKGLAEYFVKDGANIVVADINRRTGEESTRDLSKLTGNNDVVFLPVDVTDAVSVKLLVRNTVLRFGGLDLYISNAGVLKAGGLETLNEDDFDFVTKVNYRGLYLGTKYASRIMKTQHRYKPDYFTDIIQINSKSGLQGSNRNFAYAGSKFGSIGLIQSFALELVRENIKVNAVCPGNFLDGPLWSDPEKGLFVQYLRSGKVPCAKTIEDVRRYYENLVPMKRGCRVEDVYKAVTYLAEQEYETGQALPVTGGQVMLK